MCSCECADYEKIALWKCGTGVLEEEEICAERYLCEKAVMRIQDTASNIPKNCYKKLGGFLSDHGYLTLTNCRKKTVL